MVTKTNGIYNIQLTEQNNNECNIDWSLFDKIYCIHYLMYPERKTHTINELKRIGIYDLPQFEFSYNVPNKYYEALTESNIFDEQIDKNRINKRNINLQLNRLNLVRKAQLLNYNRILIIEDDVLFHKDLNLLSKYIKNIPTDYDIVNMDYWFIDKQEFKNLKADKNNYINECYLDLGQIENVWNMSFVSLNNKAMKYLCDSQENRLRPMDNYIAYKKQNEQYAKDIKFAISDINLSIQKLYSNRQNYHNPMFNKYHGQNLIFENYI